MDRPLRSLATQYKNKTIHWHSHRDEEKIFYKLRTAVAKCPKLFFYKENWPIFLCTDASDYGIGAYLYQVDPESNKEYPIGFHSKALTGAQLDWSTFEKEGYAIHQSIKKFQYLLRDVKFRIKTDHRNLLFVNRDASSKVLHWKWDIQEYNFDVEHIPGADNVAADSLSRLCSLFKSSDMPSDIDPDTVINLQKDKPYDDSINRPSYLLSFMHEPTLIEAPRPYAIQKRQDLMVDNKINKIIQRYHGWVQYEDIEETIVIPGEYYGHGGVERTMKLLRQYLPVR